jgi:heme exporter protein A
VSAISARGLTARYAGQPAAAPALRSIDLAVEPGERLLLLGPNGAGKSTFIRVFAGLMRPARGEALVLGSPPPQARRVMGVVSHATSLYDELTAEENLRFFGDLYGVPDARARAAELLERVGLPQLANERVGRLSRGQQQRVTIARALLHNPPVLLLDEPDTGLDMGAFGLLEQLVADRTVIMTTHNLANGVRLGTRAVVLAHGRLVHAQAALTDADAPAIGEILARLGRQPDTL